MEKTHLNGIEHLFDIVRVGRHRLVHKKRSSASINTYSLPCTTLSSGYLFPGGFFLQSLFFTFFRVLNGHMLLSVLMLDKVHCRPEFEDNQISDIGYQISVILVEKLQALVENQNL